MRDIETASIELFPEWGRVANMPGLELLKDVKLVLTRTVDTFTFQVAKPWSRQGPSQHSPAQHSFATVFTPESFLVTNAIGNVQIKLQN